MKQPYINTIRVKSINGKGYENWDYTTKEELVNSHNSMCRAITDKTVYDIGYRYVADSNSPSMINIVITDEVKDKLIKANLLSRTSKAKTLVLYPVDLVYVLMKNCKTEYTPKVKQPIYAIDVTTKQPKLVTKQVDPKGGILNPQGDFTNASPIPTKCSLCGNTILDNEHTLALATPVVSSKGGIIPTGIVHMNCFIVKAN